MIERLVAPSVSVAETRSDIAEIELFDAEQRALGRAVEKRRREFMTGRACARQALEGLGIAPVAIPNGPRGEPQWPPGVVGSLTHCTGYRGCAVAWRSSLSSIGIDAEPDQPLPPGVLEEVAFGAELELARSSGPVQMDRLLFSAKEAVYKAWFPLARRWLGFEDVELSVDVPAGTFRARLLVPGPVLEDRRLAFFEGAWCIEDGVICTATMIPARSSATPSTRSQVPDG